jgi:acetyl esterase
MIRSFERNLLVIRAARSARSSQKGDADMPVDARLQPVLDAANAAPAPPPGLSVEEQRRHAHTMMEQSFLMLADDGPEVASIVEHTVSVDAAGVEAGDITVRVYTPHGDGPFPAHLYLHGGGWWLGHPEHFDGQCRTTAEGAGCVVVSVDYRLAPEFTFPTAPEDCYAALQWLVDHAAELGVDANRISVGGGSAGGNLTAVVALMARDRGGPPLVFQVLEIPATDMTLSQPSVAENAEGYILSRASMEQCVGFYLASPADATNPYASPLLASDLTGLPPALVMTMEFDPLRDEGEAYGRRLQDAGVPTTIRRWDGQFHGSMAMSKLMPAEAKEYHDMVNAALRAAYGGVA